LKGKAFLILIIFLIALSSCKSEHKRLLKSTALLNFPDTVEYIPSVEEANVLEAAETICWVNHYYNRGIYEKDGYTYRQFRDGLYRRQEGTDIWELLCEVPIHTGRGLTAYKSKMYFTCYQAAKDVQGSGWNNSVFYLDLDTMEYGELLSTESLASTVVVYDSCLYFQYLKEGYMQYDGYLLDESGEVLEKLDAESEDFLCYEQNQYNIAEYETISPSSHVNVFVNPYEVVSTMKSEVIPIPYCASVLNGKTVFQQQNDESSFHYFLRDLKTVEESLLFDASAILFITDDGILYFATAGNMVKYYSFADHTSQEVVLPEFEETHNLHIDSYLTYDEQAFYFYDYGEDSGIPRILRLSYNDWSLDVVAEGEILSETEDYRVNQVDGEYFYHGDQMYPVP
jgi:hypothetical protein